MTACKECARLEAEKQATREAGALLRVVRVLRARDADCTLLRLGRVLRAWELERAGFRIPPYVPS